MRLSYDQSVEAFRAELLEWLAAHRPSPEEMAADPSVSSGHAPAWARRWTRSMFDAGWLVPGWPPERGGRNAGPIETLVYIEELARAKVPRTTNVQGLGIVAPSILDYGTDDQIRDYAMPILQLYASEARQRVALVAAEIQGAGAVELGSVAMDGHLAVDEPQGTWLEQYFHSFANTISAGASEIQRNIIAERVLGLPRG